MFSYRCLNKELFKHFKVKTVLCRVSTNTSEKEEDLQSSMAADRSDFSWRSVMHCG